MIVRTRNQGNVELRSFALTDMVRWGYQGLRNITTQTGEKDFRGIPAVNRAAQIRAQAIAQLSLYCWRGEGTLRERVDTVWQARLFARTPNPQQTLFGFWETIGESDAFRGNAFAWKNLSDDRSRILEWYALHPDQVKVEKDGTFTVTVAPGYIDPVGKGPNTYKRLDERTILHFRGWGNGGQLLAPSPVQVYRERIMATVGRQRHESRMWRRGTAIQQAIEFPKEVGREEATQWREVYRSNYEGTEAETTLVVGGGATVKPIGMTLADAQYVSMAHLTIEDAALMMGMPADMLGIPLQTRPPDMEQIRQGWLADGLSPVLGRFESHLEADVSLNFAGATTYPGFRTDGFVRGDIATEAAIVVADKQAGIITANEARALRGYPPIKGGDTILITPVGGGANPTPPAPIKDPDDTDVNDDEPD